MTIEKNNGASLSDAGLGAKVSKGFVLISPNGQAVAETFRPTRNAAKGWMAMIKDGGRYRDWKWYYGKGWRCKRATLAVTENLPGKQPD